MRNNDTRKIIDDARNTLVGQIPVPMMQCQQITLALTYKFMSDDDRQAVELGGQRHYFTGGLEKYDWSNVMSLRRDDTQRSELYRAGLSALRDAETMPAVFREIFRDAVVPYGDHRTLALFLNTMDRMEYDDSEKLGDAYEYLLKTAEAQADAGQFRTPRHIIDFIVSIVNPQKHEVIIDPACGTAGFLVSAYQHVRSQHELPGGGTSLSTPDLTRLADNLKGYDISPEMTKLAMANLYLHTQNKNPNVDNYDTLTSADHWNEYADVILANPPFMTPKGGIKPHTRFRVPARRAEVLFVDYIASHLNERGRAGIIVPEGIIFQSQNAYRQLRRLLLDESLVAVISLPGGVFNPYSGVKTSILLLDKVLAPKTDRVAFFKVENDGYDLGAQRRPIAQDDLPAVTDEINEYLRRLRAGETVDDFAPQTGLLATKDRIAEDGEYNLSGERYREECSVGSQFPYVSLGEISDKPKYGSTASKADFDGEVRYVRITDITDDGRLKDGDVVSPSEINPQYFLRADDLLIARSGSVGRTYLHETTTMVHQYAGYLIRFRIDQTRALPKYVYQITKSKAWERWITENSKVGTINNINAKQYSAFTFPLPPLEVQREIVAEVEGYQRVIDGARAVVDNWRPRIAVDPEWPMAELGNPELFRIESGGTPKSGVREYWDGGVPWITLVDLPAVNAVTEIVSTERTISEEGLRNSSAKMLPANSVVVSSRATIGRIGINRLALATNQGFKNIIIKDSNRTIPEYLAGMLAQMVPAMEAQASGATYKEITKTHFGRLRIPLPSLETQRAIVSEIEAERALVSANRELVEQMERRIRDAIARVWTAS